MRCIFWDSLVCQNPQSKGKEGSGDYAWQATRALATSKVLLGKKIQISNLIERDQIWSPDQLIVRMVTRPLSLRLRGVARETNFGMASLPLS